jgi:thioredoxin-like negative regulator of GroEL
MKKLFTRCFFFSISALLLMGCAGSQDSGQAGQGEPSPLTVVNHHTYTDEIMLYDGPAIVLFYNTQFWQSLDMKRRLEWLAEKYQGKAKFAMFHWQVNDDPSRFSLEMLPTVILYRDGAEIDRIKGIPPEEKNRAAWNDDLELWFLKNALTLQGSEYSAEFTYLFKNGYTLQVGNY